MFRRIFLCAVFVVWKVEKLSGFVHNSHLVLTQDPLKYHNKLVVDSDRKTCYIILSYSHRETQLESVLDRDYRACTEYEVIFTDHDSSEQRKREKRHSSRRGAGAGGRVKTFPGGRRQMEYERNRALSRANRPLAPGSSTALRYWPWHPCHRGVYWCSRCRPPRWNSGLHCHRSRSRPGPPTERNRLPPPPRPRFPDPDRFAPRSRPSLPRPARPGRPPPPDPFLDRPRFRRPAVPDHLRSFPPPRFAK